MNTTKSSEKEPSNQTIQTCQKKVGMYPSARKVGIRIIFFAAFLAVLFLGIKPPPALAYACRGQIPYGQGKMLGTPLYFYVDRNIDGDPRDEEYVFVVRIPP